MIFFRHSPKKKMSCNLTVIIEFKKRDYLCEVKCITSYKKLPNIQEEILKYLVKIRNRYLKYEKCRIISVDVKYSKIISQINTTGFSFSMK